MARQIPSTPSVKKISEIYRRVKDKSLILQPEFQRKFVWTSEHKEEFIDTILNGYPFPEIYIAQKGIDMEIILTSEVIVDGQQRLSTIIEYIDEEEKSKTFGKKVPKYKTLDEEDRRDFLNYNVVFRDIGDIDSETIREIFRRINLTKFSLEQIEIQQALYDGEFISTGKEILNRIEEDEFPIFSESELSRMADLHYILLLMSTYINEGYFALDGEVENSIIKYNDHFERSEEVLNLFVENFIFINKMRLPADSIWFRKSNFFTLFIESLNILDETNMDTIKRKLIEFESNIIANKSGSREDNDFSLYYSCMYSGTNNRTSRVTRAELFRKYVL
ncbi:DUF262 domain-containing protein [Oceanihabitans sp. IOP_32]|uniref:GmrSD restriction endonuclease domain-containing protein n=1 Tax=Oceanihabitans sp. IOP_32 TaxID=2529032 RepID=UPI00129301AA|nr:DUF262 domain-containing protein [Oceanihabitans sp. IOP_32]QFZ55342.1 DUF262 domain-containing protein [Oceanihabitans sp. IOP_32]